MVDAWYSEVNDCIWPGCQKGEGGKVTEHFTALIWKGATDIACTKSANG